MYKGGSEFVHVASQGLVFTLNLLCFIHFRSVQNEICDTVTAFTKFHSTVLDIIKVDDDIAIGLMGECEGAMTEKNNIVCVKYQRHFKSYSVKIYFV